MYALPYTHRSNPRIQGGDPVSTRVRKQLRACRGAEHLVNTTATDIRYNACASARGEASGQEYKGRTMTTAWILNPVSIFLVAVGVLLIFLYLWKSPQFAEQWLSSEGQRAYRRHRWSLVIAVALL